MLESLPPYRVHLETWGEAFGDLAFWMSEVLISRRFRDEYLLSGLAGLSTFEPADVLSHTSRGNVRGTPPEYFRVAPKSGAARVDVVASGIEWGSNKPPKCEWCLSDGGVLKRWSRVIIDKESWNGDDVFYPFGIPGVLVASFRFFEWAEKHRFHNLVMKPATEYSHDFYSWKRVSSHNRQSE
jgi:hypothetical protein